MIALFAKIIAGEIPGNKVYEDDMVYAFYDIDPKVARAYPDHSQKAYQEYFGSGRREIFAILRQ